MSRGLLTATQLNLVRFAAEARNDPTRLDVTVGTFTGIDGQLRRVRLTENDVGLHRFARNNLWGEAVALPATPHRRLSEGTGTLAVSPQEALRV